MTSRAPERDDLCDGTVGGGLGEFLRSLLRGIPWSERAEASHELSLPAPRSGVLRIDNSRGRTRVVGEERRDVGVEIHAVARAESQAAARRLAEATRLASSDTDQALELEVDAPRSWNRRGSANLEVRVPRGLRVEVSASNGRVELQGLRAGMRARSSNGAVRIEDVHGDLEVHASNAKVSCTGTQGRLLARTSNGRIHVDGHRGSLDAATSNGLIQVRLEELGDAGVSLATSNGRIVLELPEQLDAEVDVRVDNGVIRNQRPLCRCTRSSGGRLTGILGRGGAPIRLRTSNGSISLR